MRDFGMNKKLMSVKVCGNSHTWGFAFYGDPQHLDEWRKDGLEVYEIENIVPTWVNDFGMTRLWIFFQDILNLKNPFK